MRLTITYGLALIAGMLALTQLDQSTSIMFNPATDGPIRLEQRAKYETPISGPSICTSMISTNGGQSGQSVYVPCVATAAATSVTTWATTATSCGGTGCSR